MPTSEAVDGIPRGVQLDMVGDVSVTPAEDAAPSAAPPVARARKPRAPMPAPASGPPPVKPPGVFGAVPPLVSHWGIAKRSPTGIFEPRGWAPPGAGIELKEWPISDLSETTLRDRWGDGVFAVQWIKPSNNGGRALLRGGREVTILPLAAPAAPAAAAAPAAPAVNPAFAQLLPTFELMDLLQRRQDSDLGRLASLAELMAGRSQGLGAAELELILQRQAATQAAAIAAAVAPLQAQIATMQEGEDDEGSPLLEAAAAAAPFIKGKGLWGQAVNLAFAHPEAAATIAEKALPVLLEGASKLLAMFLPQQATAPAAGPASVVVQMRPQGVARPRAVAAPAAPRTAAEEAWDRLPDADPEPVPPRA